MFKLEDYVLALTRVVVAFLFACHGAQKLFGVLEEHPQLQDPWMLTAGVLELGGALFLALGFQARTVAFVLCGEMAVAYFKAHFPGGFWPILNHGELAVLYCFVFLYLSVRGAGKVSVDGMRGKL
jgi:putative oxidoreductase